MQSGLSLVGSSRYQNEQYSPNGPSGLAYVLLGWAMSGRYNCPGVTCQSRIQITIVLVIIILCYATSTAAQT